MSQPPPPPGPPPGGPSEQPDEPSDEQSGTAGDSASSAAGGPPAGPPATPPAVEYAPTELAMPAATPPPPGPPPAPGTPPSAATEGTDRPDGAAAGAGTPAAPPAPGTPPPPGSAPGAASGGFGAPPQQPQGGAFGAPATPPQPPQGSLSSPQDASGGYGAPQPSGGYGTPAQPGQPPAGYGTPQPGGYGTPAPSGGYGTPQQPAGYGYPQQPTPGYGYPQAAAGYGYPGGPAGHTTEPQGFGAPTAPGSPVSFEKSHGGSGGSGGGGKEWSFSGSRGPLMVLMVGVVVSALVAGGFTVYNVTRDDSTTAAPADDENPAPGGDEGGDGEGDDGSGGGTLPTEPIDASLLFEEEAPDVAEDHHNFSPGLWEADGSITRVADQQVISWNEDGEIAWTYPTNRGNCASSATASEGRVAILEGQNCEVLTVLDLADGESVVTIELGSSSVSGHPAILGDYVAVATFSGGYGWEIETGEPQWEPQAGEDCKVRAYGVHEDLFIEHQQCGRIPFDTGVPGSVVARSESGEEQWSWSYEAQHDDQEFILESVVSVDPLVIRATLGPAGGGGAADREPAMFAVKDDYSGLGPQLDFSRDRYVDSCGYRAPFVCDEAVVHDGLLYLTTTDRPATIVAVEIATGNALWEVGALEDDRAELRAIDVQDDKVIAYQVPSYSGVGRVVAIDPESESGDIVMVLPLDQAENVREIMPFASATDAVARWYDNRLVLASTRYAERYETPSLQVYG